MDKRIRELTLKNIKLEKEVIELKNNNKKNNKDSEFMKKFNDLESMIHSN